MTKGNLELYIHLPFCVRKCSYCDFLSGSYGEEIRIRYIEALKEELKTAAADVEDYKVSTIYFGGGTPSLLSGGQIEDLMQTIRGNYDLEQEGEITIEGNPGTFTEEKLQAYNAAGINRLSIGCQSVRDDELKMLGRIHTFQDFRESYEKAREAGFVNINVDLMSGLPDQTMENWEQSLRTVGEMGPEHISTYSLIIEEGTPFSRKKLHLPGEELERQMYERTEEILGEYGYHPYEISNYARKGQECRHNIGYWKRENYLGFGIGAASLMKNTRFINGSDLQEYLQIQGDIRQLRREIQHLSQEEQMEEFMFLGLRMIRGVSEETFCRLFQRKIDDVYGAVLQKYETMHMIGRENGRVFLTKEGRFVSNPILADFLLE